MRRTTFLALLAALLLAPTAYAAGPIQVVRDCEDDGVLQGNYSPSELRKAQSALPTDIDEYSDCRDVLSRAIAAKTSSSDSATGGGTGGSSAGGGTASGGTASGGTGSSSAGSSSIAGGGTPDTLTPAVSKGDWEAIGAAEAQGDRPLELTGRSVAPRLAADVGRNGLPATMAVVLALFAAAALAACLPRIRRRVVGHRQA